MTNKTASEAYQAKIIAEQQINGILITLNKEYQVKVGLNVDIFDVYANAMLPSSERKHKQEYHVHLKVTI